VLFETFLCDYHTSGIVTCAINDMFIHLLHVVLNAIFHTTVQELTKFQLT